MSGSVLIALDEAREEEFRKAARALLARPLLRAGGADADAFGQIRRHAERLREWFSLNTGWRLILDGEVARLTKAVPATTDPTYPARDPKTARPFSRRRYVLFCLALEVLERGESQTTLGKIADDILLAAQDPALVKAGVSFTLENRDERSDLVCAARLLLALAVIDRVQGDEYAYVSGAADVLYDVNRAVLARLLATPRAPSVIEAEGFDERLRQLAAEPRPESEAMRNRAIRHRLTRRLLDDPVLYFADLDSDEAAYLTSQRPAILRQISELTGLEPEIRAEGIAMVDPEDSLTDIRMPEVGTDGHATLLVAEHLAGRLLGVDGGDADSHTTVTFESLHALLREQADRHRQYWRKSSREPGAERDLAAAAVERLTALGLVRAVPGGVAPLPAIARYALADPTLMGAENLIGAESG